MLHVPEPAAVDGAHPSGADDGTNADPAAGLTVGVQPYMVRWVVAVCGSDIVSHANVDLDACRMLYGYVADNYFPLLATYAVGSVASIGFLAIYCSYCSQRTHATRLVGLALVLNGFTSVFIAIASRSNFWSSKQTENVIGILAIACGLALFASPFATISRVLRTRTAASIPIGMVTVGLASNTVWLLYGFLVSDTILIIPTAISGVFCLMQTILYVIYRPTQSPDKSTPSTDNSEDDSPMSSPSAVDFVTCASPADTTKLAAAKEMYLIEPRRDEHRSPLSAIVVLT
jgi:uncharacterized protein with PQ loop repeat